MAEAAEKVVAAAKGTINIHEHPDQQNTRVNHPGITGKTGMFHTKMGKGVRQWRELLCGGVTPKRGQKPELRRHSDFDTVKGRSERPAPTFP